MKKPVGKIGTILIILTTVILAGVAIFTAYRLYQLRMQPVAPNVPSSIPKAQEVPESDSCSLTFTISSDVFACTGKEAYLDDSRNAAGTYYLETEIQNGDDVVPGQTLVYVINVENNSASAVASGLITDVLPAGVEFVDADSECTYVSASRTVTCDLGDIAAGDGIQAAIRVTVLSSAGAGDLVNTATVGGTDVEDSVCQISLQIETSESPTPTPSATPNFCNGTCGSNINCGEELYCNTDAHYLNGSYVTGLCRNTSCPEEEDCTCPGESTATPTDTSLPVSGTNWPSLIGTGIAILVMLGSIILAL